MRRQVYKRPECVELRECGKRINIALDCQTTKDNEQRVDNAYQFGDAVVRECELFQIGNNSFKTFNNFPSSEKINFLLKENSNLHDTVVVQNHRL